MTPDVYGFSVYFISFPIIMDDLFIKYSFDYIIRRTCCKIMDNFIQNVQDQLPKSRHFYFAYNAFQDVMAKEPPEQSSLSECYKFRVVSSQGPTSQEREKGQSCSCLRMASPNIKGKQWLLFNIIPNNEYLFN